MRNLLAPFDLPPKSVTEMSPAKPNTSFRLIPLVHTRGEVLLRARSYLLLVSLLLIQLIQ
jgi:hypothetical protein